MTHLNQKEKNAQKLKRSGEMKNKEEKLEELRYAIDALHGQINTKQYQELWKISEEIELDIAIEKEEKCKSLE